MSEILHAEAQAEMAPVISISLADSLGSPLGGAIFAVPKGAGRIIVSGVAMDLTACRRGPAEPHKLFDQTLLKALLEAGSAAGAQTP